MKIDLRRKILRGLSLAGFLLVGCLGIQFIEISEMNAWAGSPTSPKGSKAAGDAERGREVFNGKGVCYYCHGIDGNKDQRPQLATDTAALIAQLNPPPVDLKNPKLLYLKTNTQRAPAIREGHLARIIHDGSSRNRAVALRDGHAEPRGPEAYLNSTSRG